MSLVKKTKLPAAPVRENKRISLVGKVISDKAAKMVIVEIERRVKHPVYSKPILKKMRCYAHDEQNSCKKGDTVEIVSCRPLSKLKRWVVINRISPVAGAALEKVSTRARA